MSKAPAFNLVKVAIEPRTIRNLLAECDALDEGREHDAEQAFDGDRPDLWEPPEVGVSTVILREILRVYLAAPRPMPGEDAVAEALEALETFAILANEDTAYLPDEHIITLSYDDSAIDEELGGPNTLLGERFMRAFRRAAEVHARLTLDGSSLDAVAARAARHPSPAAAGQVLCQAFADTFEGGGWADAPQWADFDPGQQQRWNRAAARYAELTASRSTGEDGPAR